MPWTFHPPYPDAYNRDQDGPNGPRILLLAAEPNGDVNGPEDCDMGTWMREAHTNNFWNAGGRKFFRAQLLHASIARAALGENVEALDWYGAGSNDHQQLAAALMQRIRVADLKATAGGGKTHTSTIEQWVLQNTRAVRQLFDPAPAVVVLQGGHAQQVMMRHWELLVPEDVRANALVFGLPHPSDAGYPSAALHLQGNTQDAMAKRTRLQNSPYRRSRKRWVAMRSTRATRGVREPAGNEAYEANLAALEQALAHWHQAPTVCHCAAWTRVRLLADGIAFNRLMLRYNGTIGLNRALGADEHQLPLDCEVHAVAGDTSGTGHARWTYTPVNPGGPEWVQLFQAVLDPDRYRGILP